MPTTLFHGWRQNLLTLIGHFRPLGYCYQCNKSLAASDLFFLCADCYTTLPHFNKEECFYCSKIHASQDCIDNEEWYMANAWAIFNYEPPISAWLVRFKYYQDFLAGRLLQTLVREYAKRVKLDLDLYDLIIPVPSSRKNNFLRGYWPAGLLAEGLGQKKKIFHAVEKHPKAIQQVKLGRFAREKNMDKPGIFTFPKDPFRGKKILLFDDVCTTGATARHLMRMLYKARAAEVSLLVLCREHYDEPLHAHLY